MGSRSLSWALPALGLALLACGCAGGPKPVKVKVHVTLDGQPLDRAGVQLAPDDPAGGRPASGLTGADGFANLTTNTPGDGVLPGEYTVIVSKEPLKEEITTTPSGNASDAIKQSYGAFAKDIGKKRTSKAKPKNLVPPEYADAGKTPYKHIKMPPPDGTLTLELRSTGGS